MVLEEENCSTTSPFAWKFPITTHMVATLYKSAFIRNPHPVCLPDLRCTGLAQLPPPCPSSAQRALRGLLPVELDLLPLEASEALWASSTPQSKRLRQNRRTNHWVVHYLVIGEENLLLAYTSQAPALCSASNRRKNSSRRASASSFNYLRGAPSVFLERVSPKHLVRHSSIQVVTVNWRSDFSSPKTKHETITA